MTKQRLDELVQHGQELQKLTEMVAKLQDMLATGAEMVEEMQGRLATMAAVGAQLEALNDPEVIGAEIVVIKATPTWVGGLIPVDGGYVGLLRIRGYPDCWVACGPDQKPLPQGKFPSRGAAVMHVAAWAESDGSDLDKERANDGV